jgi:hypothetical protein
LAATVGACSFSAEADLPDVEITQHGLGMPGVPAGRLLGDVSVTGSFTFSSSNTAWAKNMNSEVFVRQVTVTAQSGLPNLDFIKSAELAMSDAAILESTVEIASYARNEEAPSSSVIDVSMPTPIDITTLWTAEKTIIGVQMTGRVPEKDWTVDLTMKLAGKLTYKY